MLPLAQTVGFEPTWHCCQIDFEFYRLYRNWRNFPVKSGSCRKMIRRQNEEKSQKTSFFNVKTSQFEPISKCRFFGKNERKTGIFGTLERCWREKPERTKWADFPYYNRHLRNCADWFLCKNPLVEKIKPPPTCCWWVQIADGDYSGL